MKGLFIVLEGLDGAGKSTQAKLLKDWLKSAGHQVVMTREPGGTEISEQIREIILDNNNCEMDPVTECYLYAAARSQHVRQVIQPALAAGKIVLCDRYLASSIAYQGYARGLGEKTVMEVNRVAVNGVLPDLTIFFDMPFDQERIDGSKDRMENSGDAFYRKVYEGYKKLYDNGVVVNAQKSISDIASRIQKAVEELLDEQTD